MNTEIMNAVNEALVEDKCNELCFNDLLLLGFTEQLQKKLEGVNELYILRFNSCSIESLRNFPVLPELSRLELTDNKFPGSDLAELSVLEGLQSLSIGSNDISEYQQLQFLGKLENLIQLDLSNCPISNKSDYRPQMFSILPNLQILDNGDKNGVAMDYSDDEIDEDYEYDNDNGEEDEFEDDDDFMKEEDDDDDINNEALMGGIPYKKIKR